jgi:hypothetical protein
LNIGIDIQKNEYNPVLDLMKKNKTDLLIEYNNLKSEYEKLEIILNDKILSAEKENISNHIYFNVMALCLKELKKIIHTKEVVFQPDSKLNNCTYSPIECRPL